jgi:BirA family transcriptional regulator, biotin operon repressor / biotin---[acetyl-CoA-carboxylase] ligase
MRVFEYQEIDSTQLKAKELSEGTQTPFLVISSSQTKGKGTKGRSWHSPVGGLYFTLAVELDFNILKIDTEDFSKELCLIVVDVLKDHIKNSFLQSHLDQLSIKPINDLYFKDAKLAGVLLESINNSENSILFIGIGLNVKSIDSSLFDREIISLQDILPEADFLTFNNIEFSKKLASSLIEQIKLVKKSVIS